LPGRFRLLINRLLHHFKELDLQLSELESKSELRPCSSDVGRRLETIPGIGPLTASALVAGAGDPNNFQNARQFAAWIGLVPHQNSRDGKIHLLDISKCGYIYFRTLLIKGGRTLVQLAKTRPDQVGSWLA
jgi:transposase